ncbi:MAG: iron chelate uptake ABC transporter family permease subunit, partial [Pseudomonadota bacterium]
MLVVSYLSLTVGASDVTLPDVARKLLTGEPLTRLEHVVLFDIRLPRLFVGIGVGAALAVSGAVLQGLFRNPLADPGLVGVSAGAGVGAVSAIVLGGALPPSLSALIGTAIVPLAAFVGGWATTLLL